jgi:uroporphyrinogen-III synthase
MAKILLSRVSSANSLLRKRLAELGHDLFEISFIRTEAVSFSPEDIKADWIFFSSKNAIRACIKAGVDLKKYKLATAGTGTSQELDSKLTIHFESASTQIENEAKAFAHVVGNDTVCFPTSDKSLQSFTKFIPDSQIQIINAYTTRITPVGAPMADILIFSSPSNVEGFLTLNVIMPGQKIIAFGPSTAKSLENRGLKATRVLENVDDQEIFTTIIEEIGSL